MPLVIHRIMGIILVFSHGYFLFRGLVMRKYGGHPGRIDTVAHGISQSGIPLVIFTGFLAEKAVASLSPAAHNVPSIHIILGILPVFVIIAFTPLMSLKRRIPWLLPTINLLLLTATVLERILR